MAPLPPDMSSSTNTVEDAATRRRPSKKLRKKRREAHQPTMELPNHLRDADAEGEEDLVPQTNNAMFMHMNQSIFGLFGAACSNVDFHNRFEDQSSEDEDVEAPEVPETATNRQEQISGPQQKGKEPSEDPLSRSQFLQKSSSDTTGEKKHKRRISGNLLKSLPQLPSRLVARSKSKSSKSKFKSQPVQEEDGAHDNDGRTYTNSPVDDAPERKSSDPEASSRGGPRSLAPVMSRMLEARAEMSSRPSFDLDRLMGDHRGANAADEEGPSELATTVRDIFELDEPEEVIAEYPCWLLQSVLVDGYMYITSKHICFWAYLPKKADQVAKSGYLSKSGKRTSKQNRYWFRLKGDVLSYYHDATNLYSPHGQIDLRYGISAEIIDRDKEGVHFDVTTDERTYHFKADSPPSAKEWVKSIQRVIFRSHNDGDSVKISLPIGNVLDIEETRMMNLDFADTVKIRVIDNDETYAVDEYFFSFFSFGQEAIRILRIFIEDSSTDDEGAERLGTLERQPESNASARRSFASTSRIEATCPSSELKPAKVHENVKATLAPMSPTSAHESSVRASGEFSRTSFDAFKRFGRRSLDASPHRSFTAGRSRSKSGAQTAQGHSEKESTDSYVQSMEDPSLSNIMMSSNEEPTASQILRGSEVFHKPILQRRSTSLSRDGLHSRASDPTSPHRHSEDAALGRPRHALTTGHVADAESGEAQAQGSSLQDIAKMGTYPLQRAGMFAGYLNRTGRQVGSLLATESMGYVEKVSGMWKGGRKHYNDQADTKTDECPDPDDEETDTKGANERFRAHFALPESEKLQATYFCHMTSVLPLYGKIYLSDRHFCFRSLILGTRKKIILPIAHIETVDKEKGFRFGYQGLVVVIRGHEELFFEFGQAVVRDDCAITLLQNLERSRYIRESQVIAKDEQERANDALAEREKLKAARLHEHPEHELQLPHKPMMLNDDAPTIFFDDPKASFVNFKPQKSMRITCLTIGSRGDVQPYIALCKGLIADGHKTKIATHPEFQKWIESHGIEFAPVGGDPGELMKLVIEHGTFSVGFFKEATASFRPWLDNLLLSAWEACKGSEILIESPSAMAGIHIAEALYIPYFRAFTMPWTRSRAYPHAFVTPEHKMGGFYNWSTYVLFDNLMWQFTSRQVNKWRTKTLQLPATNLERMQPNKVPFFYNFSPSVVPPPVDYSDWIRVTGYWFLDEGKSWTPPDALSNFIQKARDDGKKLVYIGFGSIIVPDVAKMTQDVIDAVLKADVRCVLSKGWSDRANKTEAELESEPKEPELPVEIFQIQSAPHDWLFAQMDAAAHHGGAGTTGASLRAGIPTIIRPFFGDQFFYGNRVEDLGVGIALKKWGPVNFARALWEATHSERMISKARVLGESIRAEDGVATAIQCMYRDLEYARKLSTDKSKNRKPVAPAANSVESPEHSTDEPNIYDDDDVEESWTFIAGDDFNPNLVVKKDALAEAEVGLSDGPKAALGSRVLGGSPKAAATTSKA